MVMVLVVMGSTVALAFQSDADDGGTAFLLDKGNGEVHWVTILNGGSVGYTVANGLEAIGIEYSLNGDVTVDGVGTVIVGGEDTGGSMSQSGSTGVFSTVSWMAYVWTDGRWEKTCLDDVLSSNAVALGYYPEGFSPTVTPDHRSAWTMSRGDAANSGS